MIWKILVCDLIRNEDVPMGILQTLIPAILPAQEQRHHVAPLMSSNDEGQFLFLFASHTISFIGIEPQSQDEVVYCADIQADSCGCLDDEESAESDDDNDDDDDDEDENSDEEPPGIVNWILFHIDLLL